eukprot:Awhi_evm1s10382
MCTTYVFTNTRPLLLIGSSLDLDNLYTAGVTHWSTDFVERDAGKFYLQQGFNTFYVLQREPDTEFREVTISSNNAYFRQ